MVRKPDQDTLAICKRCGLKYLSSPQEFDFGFSGLLNADKKQRDLKQKNKWSANQNKIKLGSETYTPRQVMDPKNWTAL
jgi:hypothetical protein